MSDAISAFLTIFGAGCALFIGAALIAAGIHLGSRLSAKAFGPTYTTKFVRHTYERRGGDEGEA
jgi:hypothetical protein